MKWQSNFYQIDNINAHYVDSLEEIEAIIDIIQQQHSTVYVDTEFMRETTYWPILCLVQIRLGDDIFCIDALKEENQAALINLLALDVNWVLHAAKQDLEIFYYLLGYVPERFFDCQIAAELVGVGEQISYAALVEYFTGTELDKSQTRSRWEKRPLSQPQLVYAADDVIFLPALFDTLQAKLVETNRQTWLAEEQMQMRVEIETQCQPENAHIRMRRGGNFSLKVQMAVKKMAIWRETVAIEHNRPRPSILHDDDIYTLAFRVVQKNESIDNIAYKDFKKPNLVKHYRQDIEQLIASSQQEFGAMDNAKASEELFPVVVQLNKTQKDVIKTKLDEVEAFVASQSLITSRLARKKDIIDYLYQNQSGRLSKGWRKQYIRDNGLVD